MNIEVNRGKVVKLSELPPYSIALDGYVQGPEFDRENHRFSFDHHDKCLRMVTSATCKQVHDALCLGLDPEPYTIYVNDVDADTVLSVYLLTQRDMNYVKYDHNSCLVALTNMTIL